MTFDLDWKTRYARKIATAEEAVRAILPGRRILIGSGAAEPGRLVQALVTHGTQLRGNEIVHLLTLGAAPYVAPGLEDRFRHMASSSARTCGRPSRKAAPTSCRSSCRRFRS